MFFVRSGGVLLLIVLWLAACGEGRCFELFVRHHNKLIKNIKISRRMPPHRLRILRPRPRTISCLVTLPLPSTQRPELNRTPTQTSSS